MSLLHHAGLGSVLSWKPSYKAVMLISIMILCSPLPGYWTIICVSYDEPRSTWFLPIALLAPLCSQVPWQIHQQVLLILFPGIVWNRLMLAYSSSWLGKWLPNSHLGPWNTAMDDASRWCKNPRSLKKLHQTGTNHLLTPFMCERDKLLYVPK